MENRTVIMTHLCRLSLLPSWEELRLYLPGKKSAAAAKLLQLCPTLCDPTDGSLTGSAIPGILQARTLEWVAIAFSGKKMVEWIMDIMDKWFTPFGALERTSPHFKVMETISSYFFLMLLKLNILHFDLWVTCFLFY